MSADPKQIFTAEQKQELINDWKQSGKSKITFCRERGLKYHSFVSWKQDRGPGANERSFLAVELRKRSDQPFAHLTLKCGASLIIYQPVDPGFFSALLK